MTNHYLPLIEEIETLDGEKVKCRLYVMVEQPNDIVDLTDNNRSDERKPSQTYLNTIVKGAIESQLPQEYVHYLQSITDNGEQASAEMLAKLKD